MWQFKSCMAVCFTHLNLERAVAEGHISAGSVEMCLRCGGIYSETAANLLENLPVKVPVSYLGFGCGLRCSMYSRCTVYSRCTMYCRCAVYIYIYIQCFDAVGWAAGRASGL